MNRIVWMSDEIIAQTSPKNWKHVMDKSRILFNIIGNKQFNHDVVAPQEHISIIANKLIRDHFSVIVDLTGGWMSESLKNIFPSTPIFTDLHISRVRTVSRPELPTSGHILSLSHEELESHKRSFDFTKPLILDDVSFSGFSSDVAMQTLSLKPDNTTHAFFIINEGNPGAKQLLESKGSRIIFGHTLNTSEGDDGWHIKDITHHPHLEQTLGVVPIIQELHEKNGNGFHNATIHDIFQTKAFQQLIFPNKLSSADLQDLHEKGKFIPKKDCNFSESELHSTNPNLFCSPYFLHHIDPLQIRENLSEITTILMEIRDLSSDKEMIRESTHEMNRIVSHAVEGNLGNVERRYI